MGTTILVHSIFRAPSRSQQLIRRGLAVALGQPDKMLSRRDMRSDLLMIQTSSIDWASDDKEEPSVESLHEASSAIQDVSTKDSVCIPP